MKKTLLCSLLSLWLAATFVPRGASAQVAGTDEVRLPVGDRNVTITRDKLPRVKRLAPRLAKAAPRDPAGVSKAPDAADGGPPSLREVEALGKEYRLNIPTKQNPRLAFAGAEFSYWHGLNLSESDLRARFAAARSILDAADNQKVPIHDQQMLADAAARLVLIASGPPIETLCGGDTSEEVIKQAWDGLNAVKEGLGKENLEKALICTKIVIDDWSEKANEQQAERLKSGACKKTPSPKQKDEYFSDNWALSDVATAWFIRGQVFGLQQKETEARQAYKVIPDKYSCAFTWDTRGWFWRTAEGAEKQARNLP